MSASLETLPGPPLTGVTSPSARRSAPEFLAAGASLGRYVVVDLLGAGGMGAVYRAYDPELDRVVALKLVLRRASEDHQVRLQREAQAIAKLSHPNVVQVFDVGRVDGQGAVFIAMEYVAGGTLRQWLRAEERSVADILEVFLAAGEGLAAAHERGLIHRDFKPENVLVDEVGRPRVVDFGLAKLSGPGGTKIPGGAAGEVAVAANHSGRHDLPASLSATAMPFDSAITRDGATLGTPAYMPPEQHLRLEVDGRGDQFSFAVALWEALFRQLPFEGKSAGAYAMAVLDGQRRAPPKDARRDTKRDAKVPSHVLVALERALEVEAAERFPTMAELLAALRADPRARRRRRRWLAAMGVGTAGAGALLSFALVGGAEPAAPVDPCADAGAAMAELWTPARREAVDGALRRIDRPYAASTSARVVGELDELVADGAALSHEQCRRAVIGAERSGDTQLGARGACIDELQLRTARLVAALESPTPTTLEHGVDAVHGLRDLAQACRDPARLEARQRRVGGGAELEAVALQLDAAHDAIALGQTAAVTKLEAGIPEVPAAGGWPTALVLERAGLTAHVRSQEGDFEGARAVLLEAAEAVVGGPPAPLSGAAFHSQLGLLLWDIGDIDGLERGLSRALRLTEDVHGPDHPATHLARAEFGHVPFARGDYPEALAIYTAAEAGLATTLPEDDLDRLGVAGWIAETLDSMSRHAEAIAALDSLRSRYAAIYGDAHPLTLERLESLGRSRLRAGDHAGALADFEGALAGLRADPGWDDAAHEAVLLANIGGALMAGEDWAGAEARMLEALERLQAFHTASLDPEAGSEAGEPEDLTMQLVALEANLASIRSAKGDLAGAVEVLDACVARVDAQGVDASHNGIMIRLHLARVLVDSGDPEAAIERAREALERAERAGSEVLRVRASLRLAGALDGAGRTRDATRALARGRSLAETLPDASEWLEAIAAYEAQRGH